MGDAMHHLQAPRELMPLAYLQNYKHFAAQQFHPNFCAAKVLKLLQKINRNICAQLIFTANFHQQSFIYSLQK